MTNPDVPSIPVPPVEPAPKAAKAPAAATEATPAATPIPPIVDLAGTGAAAQANPYAQATAVQADPYAQAAPVQPNQYAQVAPGQAQPYAAAPYTPGPAQGLSIASMVLGIVGVLFFGSGFLISLAAVITGHLGSKRQPWAKPFWLTGIITGYVGMGMSLIAGVLFILYFVVLAAGTGLYGLNNY